MIINFFSIFCEITIDQMQMTLFLITKQYLMVPFQKMDILIDSARIFFFNNNVVDYWLQSNKQVLGRHEDGVGDKLAVSDQSKKKCFIKNHRKTYMLRNFTIYKNIQ